MSTTTYGYRGKPSGPSFRTRAGRRDPFGGERAPQAQTSWSPAELAAAELLAAGQKQADEARLATLRATLTRALATTTPTDARMVLQRVTLNPWTSASTHRWVRELLAALPG